MIDRYSTPEMAAVWADTTRFGRWLEVELLATEAHAELGDRAGRRRRGVPATGAASSTTRSSPPCSSASGRPTTTSPRSSTSSRRRIGAPAGVVDPLRADVVRRRRHRAVLGACATPPTSCSTATDALLTTLVDMARAHLRHGDDRAHPRHPRRADDVRRQGRAVGAAARPRPHPAARPPATSVAVCKLSGAVGTYSNVDPAVEAYVGARARAAPGAGDAGDRPRPPRRAAVRAARRSRRRASWSPSSCATSSAPRSAEVLEGFKAGQKGSSAMPHKRNPISAETISGLARVVRSNLLAGLQDVALWHERDISHSSVERVDPARLVAARALHGAAAGPAAARAARRTPSGCARTCGRATDSCSANPCCSRWSPPGRRATTPIASCSATRCGLGGAADFRTLLEDDPTSRCRRPHWTTRSTSNGRCATSIGSPTRSISCARRLTDGCDAQDARLMPACFSTRGLDADLAPRRVRDALALAVGLGDLDERGLDRAEVDRVAHRLELGGEITPLLDQPQLVERRRPRAARRRSRRGAS